MFNSFTDNRYPEDYRLQDDNELDEDQEDSTHGNLDSDIGKIKRTAFISCISDIDVDDDDTLVKGIWSQIQRYAQKPYVREAVIITAIYLLKTGLFMAYRAAHKQGFDIVNL